MTSVATLPAAVPGDGAPATPTGHDQANGRGFDLRVGFARDPRSAEAPEVFTDPPRNFDAATVRPCAVARERGVARIEAPSTTSAATGPDPLTPGLLARIVGSSA